MAIENNLIFHSDSGQLQTPEYLQPCFGSSIENYLPNSKIQKQTSLAMQVTKQGRGKPFRHHKIAA